MSITIKDIARLVGTSRGTVDRVFNGRGRVSQAMADKVWAVAREHHYIPNESAKLLASSHKSYTIGIVINSIGNRFFDDVLRGIQQAMPLLTRYNVSTELIQLRGYDEHQQLEAIDSLVDKGVDGLVITPIQSSLIEGRLDSLAKDNMPCVFVNSDLDKTGRLVAIGADNKESGALAGNIAMLSLQDNSTVAVVTGSHTNLGNTKRVNAFVDTVEASDQHIKVLEIAQCYDDDSRCYDAVTDIIARHEDIDLIYFCAGGIEGGINAIVDSGNTVKAITVDDNDTIRRHLASGLIIATITQDPIQQGRLPLELLAEYLVLGKKPRKKKIHTENRIRLANSKW